MRMIVKCNLCNKELSIMGCERSFLNEITILAEPCLRCKNDIHSQLNALEDEIEAFREECNEKAQEIKELKELVKNLNE